MALPQEGRTRSRERELRAFTRLVDGSTRERDRVAFASYAAGAPDAHCQLKRQRRVVTMLNSGGPALRADLREQLRTEPSRHPARTSRRRASWSPGPLRTAVVAAYAVLVVLAATGVWRLTAGGKSAAPTIDRVATLALGRPTAAPPQRSARQPTSLREQFAGVTFPDYQPEFGARAWGQRTDALGGRVIRTVYYRLRGGAPISYSVVSGPALRVPASSRHVTVAGVRITTYTEHRLSFVTLVRDRRTCVLAGAVSARTVLALAAAPLLTPSSV